MSVKVAILGASGWMGKVHTMAYLNLPFLFGPERGSAEVAWLVDGQPERVAISVRSIPGVRTSADWHEVIADPQVDLVDICLPDSLHYEVAKAALQAGKHVYCEKPMAEKTTEARELVDLAAAGNLITRVGHGFMRHPVHDLAKEIITAGEIGEITMVKASQHIDTFGDPLAPFMWRADGTLAPTGIVGDTGSHVFSIIDLLVGRVDRLIADNAILTTHRPIAAGATETAEVTNPDATNLMCRFENGAMGILDFSRTATGRKFTQTYEIYGTRGSLRYDYDQCGRLHLYTDDDQPGRRGYRAIDVGPERANYAAFLPLANFSLGYNETKYIEAAEVVESVTTGVPAWPTFENGLHITQLIEACFVSSREQRWVRLDEV